MFGKKGDESEDAHTNTLLKDHVTSMKNRMTETVEGFKSEVQQTMNKQIGTKDELVASIVQGLKKE